MASVSQRKWNKEKFELFKDGEIDTNYPLGYNLLLGYVDFDFKLLHIKPLISNICIQKDYKKALKSL